MAKEIYCPSLVGIAYSLLEEIDTSLCLQKLAMAAEDCILLLGNINPYTGTTLAFDNIDRIEGILSGGGTSHRVSGIAVQSAVCGSQPEKLLPKVDKSKQRTCESLSPFTRLANELGHHQGK